MFPAKARAAETPATAEFRRGKARTCRAGPPGVGVQGGFRGGEGVAAGSVGGRVKNRGFRIAGGGTEHGEQSEVLVVAVVATAVLLAVGTLAKLLLDGRDGIEMVHGDVLEDPEITIGQLALVDHAGVRRGSGAYLR